MTASAPTNKHVLQESMKASSGDGKKTKLRKLLKTSQGKRNSSVALVMYAKIYI